MFAEDNEIMDLEVSAEQERELCGSVIADSAVENRNSSDEENKDDNSYERDGENRIRETDSLENRNSNRNVDLDAGRSAKRSRSSPAKSRRDREDLPSEDDAETQSMMKFAKFLEDRGYIRQAGPTVENFSGQDKHSRDKVNLDRGEGRQNNGKSHTLMESDNDSVATVYQRAIPLVGEEDNRFELLSQDRDYRNELITKRVSTSSEEDPSGDESRKENERDLHGGSKDINDQTLYEKFVDCRLKEYRRETTPNNQRRREGRVNQAELEYQIEPSTSRGRNDRDRSSYDRDRFYRDRTRSPSRSQSRS